VPSGEKTCLEAVHVWTSSGQEKCVTTIGKQILVTQSVIAQVIQTPWPAAVPTHGIYEYNLCA
jgi:hypothetical protein